MILLSTKSQFLSILRRHRGTLIGVSSDRYHWPTTQAPRNVDKLLQLTPREGSILSPLSFNIFMDNIFVSYGVCVLSTIMQMTTLYIAPIPIWISWTWTWKKCANLVLNAWFKDNHVKANPWKFQAMIFKCRNNKEVFDLNIADELIKLGSVVKLPCVLIDDNFIFNEHVSNLCLKAIRLTNAFRTIMKYIPN